MKIKVFYPSGNVLHLSGEWKGPGNVNGIGIILILIDRDCALPSGSKTSDGSPPVIKSGSVFVGDPRGLYQTEQTKLILYNPRHCMEGMDAWAVEWLNEHPEWPGVLEIDKSYI